MKIHFRRSPFSRDNQREGRIAWGERGNEKENLATDQMIHLAPENAARKTALHEALSILHVPRSKSKKHSFKRAEQKGYLK